MTHLYGAAILRRPPSPRAEAHVRVQIFLRTKAVTAVQGVHPVRPPPGTCNNLWP